MLLYNKQVKSMRVVFEKIGNFTFWQFQYAVVVSLKALVLTQCFAQAP